MLLAVKLYQPYTHFPRNIRLSHWHTVTFSAHCYFFIIVPYKYSYILICLLTGEFLIDTNQCQFYGKHV